MTKEKMTPKQAVELVNKIQPNRKVTLWFRHSTERNVIAQLQAMVSEHNIKSDDEFNKLLHHIIWDGWEAACPSRVIQFTTGKQFDKLHFIKHVINHVTKIHVSAK